LSAISVPRESRAHEVHGLSACEKKEGPGERAGKAVDEAVETTGKKIEEAGEKIQDAAKDAKR
jgi:hypothetical protein